MVSNHGTVVDWKKRLGFLLGREHGQEPLEAPIRLTLAFEYRRPTGHYSKRDGKPLKDWMPTPKPSSCDVDNLAKPIMDTMTELGQWADDGEITDLRVLKFYGEEDRVWVVAEHIENTTWARFITRALAALKSGLGSGREVPSEMF